ncbi:hypothetical protein QBC33DRAFT_518873 [Phialemonium atrogriseum]|uniref:Apple domain-containing protein n=1 Tax=Phialemonium atrogriseum TaxID=1093897 RepID=A0AAJ0BUH3_9PEZI|nr:uncharacterized protein QBC33DRAFT_518873 [Phialemonium atrogriseum]KAK1763282.1 hypothetical protein QBC33DRAFT_518873 [Phialemonium atrogriseum]
MKINFRTSPLLAFTLSGFLGLALSDGPQNPFGSADDASLNGAGASGSQNPFGDNTAGGSGGGSQNPFDPPNGGGAGGGSQNPSDPSNGAGPLIDGEGCPATRAAPPTSALVYANSPICPSGDGKLYQTADGATFFIQCCTHGAASVIKTFIATDFRECMNECSKTDTCNSVQFIAHARNADPYHECKLSHEGGFSSIVCGAEDMHSYAFLIDPPPIEALDSATILCSTECPYADGQQFVTSVGEAFRMDCSKRHGTKVIYRDRQDSYKNCIEACGKLLPCKSVDYDIHRKICYYGTHLGEPSIEAPGFASARSMGCAGACGGGGCGGCGGGGSNDPQAPPPAQDTSPFPQDGYLGIP